MKIRLFLLILSSFILATITKAQKPEDRKPGWYMQNMGQETNARWQRQEQEQNAKVRAAAAVHNNKSSSTGTAPVAANNDYVVPALDWHNSSTHYIRGSFEPGWHFFNEGFGLINANKELVTPIFFGIWERENYPTVVTIDSAGEQYDGVVNSKGEYLLQPIYRTIYPSYGVFNILYADFKSGLADKNGKVLTKMEYENIFTTNGYFAVGNHGKFNILDNTGKEIISTPYDFIKSTSEFFVAGNNNKLGLIDRNGKEIIAMDYDSIKSLGPLFETYLADKKALFDKTGKKINIPGYLNIEICNARFIAYRNSELKIGIVDLTGSVIAEPKYDYIHAIETLQKYEHSDTNAMVDKKIFDLIEVRLGDGSAFKGGLLNNMGQEIFAPVYDGLRILSDNGLFRMICGHKEGLMDGTGKIIIEPRYDFVTTDKKNGHIFVGNKESDKNKKENFSTALYDYNGHLIFSPIKYQLTPTIYKGLFFAMTDNKTGLVDETGKVLIEAKYEVLFFSDYKGVLIAGDKIKGDVIRGMFDDTGKVLIEPQKIKTYDDLIEMAKAKGVVLELL